MLTFFIVLCMALGAVAECNFTRIQPVKCCPLESAKFNATIAPCQLKEYSMSECEQITCVMKEMKILKPDGKIDKSGIKSTLKTFYSSEWDSQIDSSVTECLAYIDKTPSDCQPNQFTECFSHKMIMKCPYWKKSPECDESKAYLKSCMPPEYQ